MGVTRLHRSGEPHLGNVYDAKYGCCMWTPLLSVDGGKKKKKGGLKQLKNKPMVVYFSNKDVSRSQLLCRVPGPPWSESVPVAC